MQTQEAIAKRRSVREYLNKEIPKDILIKITEAGRLAPTARNEQPWEFVVVTDKDKIAELAKIVSPNGSFLSGASAAIVVISRDTKYYLEDGCSATENILLQATDLGIGSCWIAGDKKPYCDLVKEALGAPQGHKLVSVISLGYSKENLEKSEKKELDKVLHWQCF